MELLCSYKLMYKVNFLILLKYLVFISFISIYHTSNDVIPLGKSLEKTHEPDKVLNIKFNRLLAKHDIKRELEHSRLREELPDRRAYKSERNTYDNVSAYSGVKSKTSSNIDIYMKNYKNRYMRKKGLSKLDCYCENKVFSKFNNICDIGKNMQYDEKRANKFFLKKYGRLLILFALMPALGLICPILFGIRDGLPGILGQCPFNQTDGGHFEKSGAHKTTNSFGECHRKWMYDNANTISIFGYISDIFSFAIIIIVLFVVFYMLIKVIKYEKIKYGKGKMSIK